MLNIKLQKFRSLTLQNYKKTSSFLFLRQLYQLVTIVLSVAPQIEKFQFSQISNRKTTFFDIVPKSTFSFAAYAISWQELNSNNSWITKNVILSIIVLTYNRGHFLSVIKRTKNSKFVFVSSSLLNICVMYECKFVKDCHERITADPLFPVKLELI